MQVNVPSFYFPNGKPITPANVKELTENVDKVFGPASAKKTLTNKDFDSATTDIFKIPKIFRDMLYTKVE